MTKYDQKTIENKIQGLNPSIITVADLIKNTNINFPDYQRPYKWKAKHVNQLINDIITFKEKPAYRLGTVVVHLEEDENKPKEENKLNVVDGQQRTITLLLIAKAILKRYRVNLLKIEHTGLKEQLEEIESKMPKPGFINEITKLNIQQNFAEIERYVASFDEEIVFFLFNKCEFVRCILSDISEAFQFFDAQNARGKDLDPHDLLKAYHLREFSDNEKKVLPETVSSWESLESKHLVRLFGDYLFRIKGWIKGRSSRFFTKKEAELFKGITLDKIDNYPFTKSLRITHFYVDKYNQSIDRQIDLQKMNYPFQLDGPVINGKRFFEMVHFYEDIIANYTGKDYHDKKNKEDKKSIFFDNLDISEEAEEIIYAINNYDKRMRDGDRFVRNLFDCALIYYHDKFGKVELSRFIEIAFIWSYKLRLKQASVYLSTADNYVLDNNIFKTIHESVEPYQVLNFSIPELQKIRIGNQKTLNYKYKNQNCNLIDIFKKLRYYYGE